ncbi:hypothetical protein IB235_13585 [Paracoccus sp. PAR01]|nr:hypothetical protein [Paracoccus sp. PAR01]
MALADAAHDNGTSAFISKYSIAAGTELSLATVKRSIKELIAAGLIREDGMRACSHGHTVVYALDLPAIAALTAWKPQRELSTTGGTVNRVQGEPGSGRTPTGVRVNPHRVHGDPLTVLEQSKNKKGVGEREAVDNPQPIPKQTLSIEKRQRLSEELLGRKAENPAPIPEPRISATLTDEPLNHETEYLQ